MSPAKIRLLERVARELARFHCACPDAKLLLKYAAWQRKQSAAQKRYNAGIARYPNGGPIH